MNGAHISFFTFQGKTGVPGFPGNDGSPVSKPLFLYILSTYQKNALVAHTDNDNPLEVNNSEWIAPTSQTPYNSMWS